MTDKVNLIISFVSATIAAVAVYYTYRVNSKKISLIDKYYQKVLIPFYLAYRKKKNRNWSKFINRKFDKYIDCIPPYVIRTSDKQPADLDKVLLYDYIHLKRNNDNLLERIFQKVSIVFGIVLYYVLIGLIAFCITFLLSESFLCVFYNQSFEVTNTFTIVLLFLLLIILFIVTYKSLIAEYDQYTLKIRRINYYINKRVNWCKPIVLDKYQI